MDEEKVDLMEKPGSKAGEVRNFDVNDRPPSFRSSRQFRNFKNPPQPHMCIRDETVDGEEVFINVMSWTRIVMPVNQNDPIPLYGGIRIFSSNKFMTSPSSVQPPAVIFAVMANPEVLKKTNRNNVEDQELIALVELMCEFVEAMNPGLKLKRKSVVLRDRDLSGELKDIWGAVQAKRENEREHLIQEKMANAGKPNSDLVVYTELGPDSAPKLSPKLDSADSNGNAETSQIPDSNRSESAISSNGGGGAGAPEEGDSLGSPCPPQQSQIPVDNVPNLNSNNNNNDQQTTTTLALTTTTTPTRKESGDGKEVTDKPKKEKTLGFLQNGRLFGKKKDKEKDKEGKEPKTKSSSGSFKSKLLRDKSEKNEQNLSSLESNMNALNLSSSGKQDQQEQAFTQISVKAATTAK